MKAFDEAIAEARGRGDDVAMCRALVARAAQAVAQRLPDSAIADLREAARVHASVGRAVDASRCLCQAATVARLGGDLDDAIALALEAHAAADEVACRRAARIEEAEVYLLARDPRRAAECLAEARAYPASDELGIAVAMKHAEALILAGDLEAAERAWSAAVQATSDAASRAEVLVRRATLLVEAAPSIAPGAVVRAKAAAIDASSAKLLADVALLEATLATRDGELEVALKAARNARALALQCEGAMVYASAAAVIARLCERLGDRRGAYESLALGRETLARLVGAELAAATFDALLAELGGPTG